MGKWRKSCAAIVGVPSWEHNEGCCGFEHPLGFRARASGPLMLLVLASFANRDWDVGRIFFQRTGSDANSYGVYRVEEARRHLA